MDHTVAGVRPTLAFASLAFVAGFAIYLQARASAGRDHWNLTLIGLALFAARLSALCGAALARAHQSLVLIESHPARARIILAGVAAMIVTGGAIGAVTAISARTEGPGARPTAITDLSAAGFARHVRDMDGAMLALAQRFDQPGRFGRAAANTENEGAAARAGLRLVSSDGGEEDSSPVFRWQALSPEQARMINASLPVSTTANPPARPFRLKADSAVEGLRALDCLTAAVYYEAAKESDAGQAAVAQVVLNRMRHAAYPKTVCGVVFEGSQRTTGCQFSFTCDGSLERTPIPELWSRAAKVASAALNGGVMKAVGNATHYHAVYVAPYWMPNLVKVATVGAHVFYRWEGGWGRPGAFTGRYGGAELDGMPNTDLRFLTPVKMETLTSPDAPKASAPEAVAAPVQVMMTVVPPEAMAVPAEIDPTAAVAAVTPMTDPFKVSTTPRVNSRLAIPKAGRW